jgi:hypothetical protein
MFARRSRGPNSVAYYSRCRDPNRITQLLQGDPMRQLLTALLGLVLLAPAGHAQSVCLPSDSTGKMLLSYMRRYVVSPTGTTDSIRVKLGLPQITDSTTVKLVTQEQICKKARDAYVANAPVSASGAEVQVDALLLLGNSRRKKTTPRW